MTIRPIRYLGDPILRKPAKRVRKVDDSIRRLVDDMIESMVAAQGIGLAAPQIGVGLRIVVLGMPEQEPLVLINPTIARRSGERRLESEGCLSVPGYRGAITRSQRVTVKALDIDGKPIRVKADDDLLAQALEHEVDHVNGVLYVDRLDSPDDLVKLDAQGWAQDRDGDGDGDSEGEADDADSDGASEQAAEQASKRASEQASGDGA